MGRQEVLRAAAGVLTVQFALQTSLYPLKGLSFVFDLYRLVWRLCGGSSDIPSIDYLENVASQQLVTFGFHVLLSGLLALMGLQLWLRKGGAIHRWMGRFLMGFAAVGFANGMYLGLIDYYRPYGSSYGFAIMTLIDGSCLIMSFRAATRREYEAHRVWAVRLYSAMIFSAIVYRIILIALASVQVAYPDMYSYMYSVLAAVCPAMGVVVANWYLSADPPVSADKTK